MQNTFAVQICTKILTMEDTANYWTEPNSELPQLFAEKHFDIVGGGEGVDVEAGRIRVQPRIGRHIQQWTARLDWLPLVGFRTAEIGRRKLSFIP